MFIDTDAMTRVVINKVLGADEYDTLPDNEKLVLEQVVSYSAAATVLLLKKALERVGINIEFEVIADE